MRAEKSNAVAVGVRDEIEQAGMGMTVARSSGGSNPEESREVGVVEALADLRRCVEDCMEWCGVLLVGRWFRAMAVDGSISYIYDCRRVWHDICVVAWCRRRWAFDRNQAVLLTGLSSSDMLIVKCEKKVSYYQKLREVMMIIGVTELPAEAHLALCYFEKAYIKLHLLYWGRPQNRVLELEGTKSHCCMRRIAKWRVK